MAEGRGFFADLFDVSFRASITNRVPRVLFGLRFLVISIGALFALITGLGGGGTGAIVSLMFVPLDALPTIIFVCTWNRYGA